MPVPIVHAQSVCTSAAQREVPFSHVTLQRYRGRIPTDVPSPQVCRNAASTHMVATSCKWMPFGDVISIGSHDDNCDAHTCHRRRLSRRKPAAASGTRTPYAKHNEHAACMLASSPKWAGRDAKTPHCASIRTRASHPIIARFRDDFLRNRRPKPARGWLGMTCSRHEARSHHISGLLRSNARGRGDLHSPKDAWTSQTHTSPGIRQGRRGTNAASSHFRRNGVSILASTDCSVLAGRLRHYASSLKSRGTMRVFHRRSGRHGPTSTRRAKVAFRGEFGRQPGGESGRG
jgi:hypothetical protein